MTNVMVVVFLPDFVRVVIIVGVILSKYIYIYISIINSNHNLDSVVGVFKRQTWL